MEQKKNSMSTGKEKSGASGTDLDSIRSSILDESVIVCNIFLLLSLRMRAHDIFSPLLSFVYFWQVFSTLSFSGSSLFSKWNRGFDVVIIDEAAQAVSPLKFSTLLLVFFFFFFFFMVVIGIRSFRIVVYF